MTRRFASAIPLFSLALAPLGLLASPEAPAVYPNPHAMKVTGGMLTLSSGAKILGAEAADADAVKLLRARIALAGNAAGGAGRITEIVIGERGEPAVKGFDSDIPAVSGAYRIVAAPGRLVIVGHDARGTFYAMQTLRQLLDDDANPADLPAVEITDFPTIPFRGIVEGFYGTPDDCWNHENRLSLIAFCGKHKMDTYIYGPKDDPYHRGQWRKPYPQKESERIRELVVASKAAKVNFVWAIHPGGDIKWTEADYQAAKSKFEDMYKLGVRSFSLFFDDIGGEGTKAEKQAEMLNRLHKEFVKVKGDVTPLILCPTEYNKGWANQKKGTYLDILGETLDPSIQVMWTGNTVVSDLDKDSMEYINGRLRRKAYIWWNAPCNDFCRTNLNMGPAYGDTAEFPAWIRDWAKSLGQRIFGNTSDAAELMSGFTSNPMGRSEASKVGLYGVAGYCWNPKAYDALKAWEGAMKDIMPKASDAFLTFCAHNQDNGPNGHGYRRPESLDFKPVADAYLAAFRTGKVDKDASAGLVAEFKKIAAAPAAIRAGADNPELLRQAGAWLDAFEQLGIAGQSVLDAAEATDRTAQWAAYSRAAQAMHKRSEVDSTSNRNQWQPGIKVGSLVMAPLVDEVMKSVGSKLQLAATGKPALALKGIVSRGSTGGIEKMSDADPASYFYWENDQRAGDWIGLEIGAPTPVSRVSLVMGRKDGDHDFVKKGRLEYSADGKTWAPLGEPTSGDSVFWEGKAVNARALRYRVLEDAKAWVAVRSFAINPAASQPKVLTSVKNLSGIPVRKEKDWVVLTPQLEVFKFETGKDVGIMLPSVTGIRRVELDLSAPNPAGWAKVEATEDGKTWRELKLKPKGETGLAGDVSGAARAVRVRNAGKPADVKIALLKVRVAEDDEGGSAFVDGRLDTLAPLGAGQSIEIPADARGVTLFFGAGSGKGAAVGVASTKDGATRSLGAASGDIAEYELPAGAKWLVIKPAAPAATLHEAVWKSR